MEDRYERYERELGPRRREGQRHGARDRDWYERGSEGRYEEDRRFGGGYREEQVWDEPGRGERRDRDDDRWSERRRGERGHRGLGRERTDFPETSPRGYYGGRHALGRGDYGYGADYGARGWSSEDYGGGRYGRAGGRYEERPEYEDVERFGGYDEDPGIWPPLPSGRSSGGWRERGGMEGRDPYRPDRPYPSGRFRGTGPKGYARSDERICEDVCDRLMDDDDLDASDIEVRVSNGEVTLSGSVPERWLMRRAEDLVESIRGVKDVANQLRAQSTEKSRTSTGQRYGTSTSTGSGDNGNRPQS